MISRKPLCLQFQLLESKLNDVILLPKRLLKPCQLVPHRVLQLQGDCLRVVQASGIFHVIYYQGLHLRGHGARRPPLHEQCLKLYLGRPGQVVQGVDQWQRVLALVEVLAPSFLVGVLLRCQVGQVVTDLEVPAYQADEVLEIRDFADSWISLFRSSPPSPIRSLHSHFPRTLSDHKTNEQREESSGFCFQCQ